MKRRLFELAVLAMLLAPVASLCYGDTFGSGANTFEIEFVTIGQPGNPADTTGDPNPAGSVPYVYRIGKFEIPEDAVRKANAQSALDGQPLGITLDSRGPNKPATRVSWFNAAKFVNWLNTSLGSMPAYKFDANGNFQLWMPGDVGYNPANLFRNSQARYFLPGVDEWYKAAFYDPHSNTWFDFPNGSDIPPIPVVSGTDPNTAVFGGVGGPADTMLAGGPSPFGTVGQAGNVWEWDESAFDLNSDNPSEVRGVRGFGWLFSTTDIGLSSSFRSNALPTNAIGDVGFRIASVPEPMTFWLLLTGAGTFLLRSSSLRRRPA